jgi:cytidylate kinase
MRKIIVLEGPDFAGKSTLAARLQTTAGVAIRTNGPPARQATSHSTTPTRLPRPADPSAVPSSTVYTSVN